LAAEKILPQVSLPLEVEYIQLCDRWWKALKCRFGFETDELYWEEAEIAEVCFCALSLLSVSVLMMF